jgi:two-component sensor histidine kinase
MKLILIFLLILCDFRSKGQTSDSLLKLGKKYFYARDTKRGYEFSNKAALLFKAENNIGAYLGASLNSYANHIVEGKYSLTIQEHLQLFEEAKKYKNDTICAKINNNLSSIYSSIGLKDSALSSLFKSRNYFEKLKMKKEVLISNINIAGFENILNPQSEHPKLLLLSMKKEIFELNDSALIANWYRILGDSYSNFNRDSVVMMYEESLNIYNLLGDKSNLSTVYTNISEYHDLKDGLIDLMNAYKIDKDDSTSFYANTCFLIGENYFKQNDFKNAEKFLLEGKGVSENIGAMMEQEKIYKLLATIYFKSDNFLKSSEYYKKSLEIGDSINIEKQNKLRDNLSISYQTKENLNKIAIQQTQLSAERKQKYWLYGGIGSLALVIGGLVYFYNRIKKQKTQIQHQRQEILHNNRNNIQQLISIFSRQSETVALKENSIANQERLYTLNLLNKLLYENGQSNNANVKDYLLQLGEAKEISSGAVVSIQINTPSITLKSNLLKDIGLIINELTTNSIKYAFAGIEKPLIKINVEEHFNFLKLTIADNGNGLPTGFDISTEKTSFGLDFVKDLVEQHHGKIKAYNKEGAIFEIELKV